MRAAILLLLVGCGYENSQAHLRTAINAQHGKLHRCYAQTLARDADMEGNMNVLVHVPRGDGKIATVEPSGVSQVTNPDLHAPLHRCMQRVLVGLSIAGIPIQDDLYVEYTFRFEPESESAPTRPARARVARRRVRE